MSQVNQTKNAPVRSNEPPVWLLFSAGGMVSAILFPMLLLIVGVLLPLGWVSAENLIALAHTLFGKIVLLAAMIFPMWAGMHRIHHTLHDFKIHLPAGGWIFYGLSAIYSVVAFLAVLGL